MTEGFQILTLISIWLSILFSLITLWGGVLFWLKHSKEISSVMFPFTLANDLSEQDKANLNTIFPPEIELDSEIAEPELDKSEPTENELGEELEK